jgi:hypothetical protein
VQAPVEKLDALGRLAQREVLLVGERLPALESR